MGPAMRILHPWRRAAALALVIALVSACGGDSGDDQEVPNPASVFCVERGGTVRIVTAADGGQSGMCRLPDGAEVDEWVYYRQFHGDSTTASDGASDGTSTSSTDG